MPFQPLAHRRGGRACAGLGQIRLDTGRRLRHRRAEQVLEHPLSALHRRGPVAGGRGRQEAALAEQSAPRAVVERTRRKRLPRTFGMP
jgi:hypothetical protein